ncbi:MAG: Fur family transcriptional regulator, ferric uptake regulator [Solirubrobacterales bacterium]|jgi:Fur family ferric uptake transcriptional regulator|nr:Fur family transcriptional regulator, ferric uptake regulator [Solirubrobacterales bacterium]
MTADDTQVPSPPADLWTELASAELSRSGHRASTRRAAVIELLGRQQCVVSAREISEQLRAQGDPVGIATVYRTLELLTDLRLVQRLEMGSEPGLYEPAMPSGDHHHHHFVCDECGRVTPFEDPGLERAIKRLAGRMEYTVGDHEVVLRGGCPDCAPAP